MNLFGMGSAPIPDEYWDMEVHRDEKRVAARRALIQLLAEVAPEPWARGGDLDKQPQRPLCARPKGNPPCDKSNPAS